MDAVHPGMNRWLAVLILLAWTIIAAGSLRMVSSSGDFPTSVKALVSNLDAVHSDELIAAHFSVGQNETTLYCTLREQPRGRRTSSRIRASFPSMRRAQHLPGRPVPRRRFEQSQKDISAPHRERCFLRELISLNQSRKQIPRRRKQTRRPHPESSREQAIFAGRSYGVSPSPYWRCYSAFDRFQRR